MSVGELPPLRRNRDFLLLWGGMAVSVLGSKVSTIAYPLLVLALTGSASAAGAVAFVATLPYLVFALPAGVVVDRFPRKRLMLLADAGRLVGMASLVVVIVLDRVTLVHIGVVAFVEGVLFVVYTLAQSIAVRHVVPKPQLTSALGHNEARERAALMLGQPLGGVLFGLARWLPFVADAVSYVVSLVTLSLIRKPFEEGEGRPPPRPVQDLKDGVRWLWGQGFLRASALLVAASNFLFQALFLVLIVRVEELGGSSTTVGLVLGAAGIGGVVGSLSAPWFGRRLRLHHIVIGANWLWALLLLPVAFVPSAALGALFAAMAFVGPVWNVAVKTVLLGVTPDHLLGRVTSASSVLSYGALPLGYLAGGLLLDGIGTVATTLALTGFMVVVAAAALAAPAIRRATRLATDEAMQGERI